MAVEFITNVSIPEARGILETELISNLTERVSLNLSSFSSLTEVTCAASLAHHGLLGPVSRMNLLDGDLASVPAGHLVSLVSSVTQGVAIIGVTGCDMVTILDR